MSITGIEIICDKCPKALDNQVSHVFIVNTDYAGDPQITCRCPTCNELIEVVYVGGRVKDRKVRKNG